MADTNRTEVPTAWLTRAGRHGEREDFVLEHGLAGTGWADLPDLSGISSRGEMKDMIRRLLPGRSKMSVANYSGQLWALRAHVSIGDLVVLPRKKTRQIAIGVVTREYWYRDDPDPGRRHVASVDWKRTDVPWEAAHEDLRNSLSSLRTICAVKCDDGAQRLRDLMTTGRDPGTPNRPGAMTPNDRMTPSELHAEFLAALSDLVVESSDLGVKPLELKMEGSLPLRARVYMYNATRPPGGRPAGEYKIQLIVPNHERGRRGNFDLADGRIVLLVGYAADDAVFVLWDAGAYRDFAYSRNLQVKSETILAAFARGIGLQERRLRPGGGMMVRETVVAATGEHLAEAIALRVDLSRKRLLGELN
ncbi:MAG: hypothetical protein F4110_14815 [Acidimicrobiaceae bacterium]|nr:hypothetical protein [Acidimicrobiaceae bacterium]MYE96167.1 hypothetical protein [Acidimicrobiaceae bacterium]MYI55227.1 hypothetical protein [Acidimicrobiaceae bacterium]